MKHSQNKIVIEAFSARRGGGQTYLINLLTFANESNAEKIYVFAPEALALPAHEKIERPKVNWPVKNPLMRAIWQRYFLPEFLKANSVDLLFCPGGVLATAPPGSCRSVIMFRNMAPFDPVQRSRYPTLSWDRIRLFILERVFLRGLMVADLVIFISKTARNLIEARIATKGAIKNSVMIPHGIPDDFKTAHIKTVRPNWLPEDPYLLYVSTFDRYKHHLEVIRAFKLLTERRVTKEKLILAGFCENTCGKEARAEIRKLGLEDKVLMPGQIKYSELPAVYQHAKLHIFASACENCPNILLEMLASGRPIVCSNIQPMPEFAGDAPLYFDPTSARELCDKLLSIIDDEQKLNDLGRKALEQSKLYDWKDTAKKTWKALEDLIDQNSTQPETPKETRQNLCFL